jgi:hypothetical protein
MSINIPGIDDFPPNVVGPAPLDVAAGTEIGHVMGRHLANRTKWLLNRIVGRLLLVEFAIVDIADASSTYPTAATTTSTSFGLMSMQASISAAAAAGDLLVAWAQWTGNYTGANFGEFRLIDKAANVEGPHAKLAQDNVDVSGSCMLFDVLGAGGGRTIDLEGRVNTAGTLTLKGGAQLYAAILREVPAP